MGCGGLWWCTVKSFQTFDPLLYVQLAGNFREILASALPPQEHGLLPEHYSYVCGLSMHMGYRFNIIIDFYSY